MTVPAAGVIPVVPTIFDADEALDLPGLRRVLDYLVDADSDMVCLLANYSEQYALSDAERDQVLETAMTHLDGRVPACVTTSHFSSRIAAERSRRAQDLGADMVMLMPPFVGASMRVGADDVVDWFARVAAAIDIPIMVQDAPMSPTLLAPELLARIAREVPGVQAVKVETARAAATLRTLGELAPDLPGLFDGEEAITLIPDLEAGAVGCMSSATLPHELHGLIADFHAGERDLAEHTWERLLPLIHYENRQVAQAAVKVLLVEAGVIAHDTMRHPGGTVHPDTRRKLVELAQRRDIFLLRWGKEN